jgi:hypothetical protein
MLLKRTKLSDWAANHDRGEIVFALLKLLNFREKSSLYRRAVFYSNRNGTYDNLHTTADSRGQSGRRSGKPLRRDSWRMSKWICGPTVQHRDPVFHRNLGD